MDKRLRGNMAEQGSRVLELEGRATVLRGAPRAGSSAELPGAGSGTAQRTQLLAACRGMRDRQGGED